MKKIILLVILIIYSLLITSCNNNLEGKRIRIIAESNETASIEEKIIIKETIKKLFDRQQLDYQTINTENLTRLLKKELSNNLYQKIKIDECISYYPAKAYQNKMIPSGNYETILITIGEGEGNNFWTLLYPEYFGYEFEENNEIEYRSYVYDLFNKQNKS